MKKQVLSQRELETEKILQATLPEYTIRANMRLVDVIHAGNQFRYMSSYHLDFVICNNLSQAVAAVELDDSTHDTADGRRRDANKNRWLAEANLKLIRIRKPNEAYQIQALIAPRQSVPQEGEINSPEKIIITQEDLKTCMAEQNKKAEKTNQLILVYICLTMTVLFFLFTIR